MGLSTVVALALVMQPAGGIAATVPVTGRVVDGDGRAVTGAEVMLAEGTTPIRNTPRGRISTPAVLASPAILARGKTDAQGRFRVELPRRSSDLEYRVRPLVLWGWSAGRAPALRTIPDEWPEDGEDVTLTLSSPPPLPVRVVDPDGRPVSGAEVAPGQVRGRRLPLELVEHLAATTDREGRATLAGAAAEALDEVRVVAGPFGAQVVRTPRPDADGVRTIALAPVGRVEGRLTADDARAVAGVPLRLRSSVDDLDAEAGVGGVAEVVSDAEGRFTVPALAAGTLAVSFRPHGELPYRGDYLDRRPVEPGATTHLEIPLQPAVRVTGTIREAGTGAPLAGVRLSIDRDITAPFVMTDAKGNYAAYSMPGVVLSDPIFNPPEGYTLTAVFPGPQVPPGVREFQAGIREMRRSSEAAQGLVVDRQGHPVLGAEITATWTVGQYPDGPTRDLQARGVSDRKGLFRIEAVPAKVPLRLSARRRGVATDQVDPVQLEDGPITLTLDDTTLISLDGRVVDTEGRPVSWATVSLESDRRIGVRPGGMGYEHEVVLLDEDGGETVLTDAEGRFKTARVLFPGRIVRARVEAPGCWQMRSGWIESGTTTTFPDIVVVPNEPSRVVEGRVIDTAGRPLAGLAVFQSGDGPLRTRTVTDAAGRFRLPGVFRARAIVFVEGEGEGVPIEGHVIDADDRPVELIAHGAGEPGGRPLKVLPPPASAAEMRALALRLLAPDIANRPLERVFQEDRVLAQIVLLADLARDPVTLNGLSDLMRDSIRCDRALSSLPHDPREADVLAEQIRRPATRSKYFRLSADRLPPADRDQRLSRLERALQYARAETTEALRLAELGMIGYRLLDLGEHQRGTAVLREGRELADRSGVTLRVRFAPYLARVDGPAALALIKGEVRPPYRGTFGRALFLCLAELDPGAAERALRAEPEGAWRDLMSAQSAGRMSIIDRVHARRLAESIGDSAKRGLALAWMARNLRPTDPKAATALLDESRIALAELDRDGRGPEGSPLYNYKTLFPVAEALGPEVLRRVFWTAAAMRPARPPGGDPERLYEERATNLAFVLARYDRELARLMVAPLLGQPAAIHNTDSSGRSLWWSIRAAAAIDPAWTVEFVEAMPDDSPLVKERPKERIRRMLAGLLARGFDSDWTREFHDDYRDQAVP